MLANSFYNFYLYSFLFGFKCECMGYEDHVHVYWGSKPFIVSGRWKSTRPLLLGYILWQNIFDSVLTINLSNKGRRTTSKPCFKQDVNRCMWPSPPPRSQPCLELYASLFIHTSHNILYSSHVTLTQTILHWKHIKTSRVSVWRQVPTHIVNIWGVENKSWVE